MLEKNRKYFLINAIKRNEKYPVRFEIPSEREIMKLRVGNFIKLIFNNKERMWVRITKIKRKGLIGHLNGHPIAIDGLKYGDIIKFKRENIIDIME